MFPEEEFDEPNDDGSSKQDSGKIYKIRYTLNMVPILGNHIIIDSKSGSRTELNSDLRLMQTCTDSEELSMFKASALQDVIQFKWDQYGFRHHMIGCCMHILQICIVVFYVNLIYYNNSLPPADRDGNHDNPYALVLLGGIVYPAVYCLFLIYNYKLEYFMMPGNWLDVFYIGGSIAQCFLHLGGGPFNFSSKFVMIFVILFSLIRTFKFMRIFKDFSPIVTMLTTVVYDLKAFILFYFFLNALFSLLFGIIGIDNLQPDINA